MLDSSRFLHPPRGLRRTYETNLPHRVKRRFPSDLPILLTKQTHFFFSPPMFVFDDIDHPDLDNADQRRQSLTDKHQADLERVRKRAAGEAEVQRRYDGRERKPFLQESSAQP